MRRQDGFTFVEAVVVTMIIGILAAIAIPIFLGDKSTAQNSQPKSELKQALGLAQNFYGQHSSYKPTEGGTLCAYLQTSNPRTKWVGEGCSSEETTLTDPTEVRLAKISAQELILCSKSGSGKYYCIKDKE